ncbi:unnamed protein product [Victoria cruziana]
MWKYSHLPPRCPLQSRGLAFPSLDSGPLLSDGSHDSCQRHSRSPSLNAVIEEQPSWLDDLLGESEKGPGGSLHRRSSSDSAAFSEPPTTLLRSKSLESDKLIHKQLDELATECPSYNRLDKREDAPSSYAHILMMKQQKQNESSSAISSGCIYGPNSPRLKPDIESPITSEEYSGEIPLSLLAENIYPFASELSSYNANESSGGTANNRDPEVKTAKRHSGQRSRVRKLQYIAELERRVEMLQMLESKLARKVDLLYQQRVILTVENNELKHRIARLAKEKMIKDGQCQSLKSQIERLKLVHTNHSKNRRHSSGVQRSPDSSSELSWQMLDISKLTLGGGRPISLIDSYRS